MYNWFSDHSTDLAVVSTAVASGAEVVEKHIALSNQKNSIDIAFSAKGKQIKEYSEVIKKTYSMIGKNFYSTSKEKKNKIFRRSIYAIKDIKKGEKFTTKNIKVVRPNNGLDPKWYFNILNKKSRFFYKMNNPIKKI